MENYMDRFLEIEKQMEALQIEKDFILSQIENKYLTQLKEDGQSTINDKEYKLTFKRGYNYKLNVEKYMNAISELNIDSKYFIHQLKVSFDEKRYKEIIKNTYGTVQDNQAFDLYNECLDIKPAKTNLKIKKEC